MADLKQVAPAMPSTRPRTVGSILSASLAAIGLWLCYADFGTMFWGNWLHSGKFSAGAILLLIAFALGVASATGRKNAALILLGIMLFAYFFFFWSFLGWLMLHNFIWKLEHPGKPLYPKLPPAEVTPYP